MSTPKSGRLVTLQLDELDVGQTIDALDTRAEAYERTAEYMEAEANGEELPFDGEFFEVEEVRDADEATAIAEHFRHIQSELERQLSEWRKSVQ